MVANRKKYFGGTLEQVNSQDSEVGRVIREDSVNKFYYAQEGFGALFVLRDSDCSATVRISKLADIEPEFFTRGLPTYRIPAGWNFITIHPWMVNKNFGEFMGTCEITKAFTFNPVTGWQGGPVSSTDLDNALVTEQYVGVTYAMKFSSNCNFGLKVQNLVPPPLPE